MNRILIITAAAISATFFFLAGAATAAPPGIGGSSVDVGPGVDVPADEPVKGDELLKRLGACPLVMVANVTDAKMRARTMSIPPSILMDLTVNQVKMLKGQQPKDTVYSYTSRQPNGNAVPAVGGQYVIGATPQGQRAAISVLVEATEDNLKTAQAAAASKPASAPAAGGSSLPATSASRPVRTSSRPAVLNYQGALKDGAKVNLVIKGAVAEITFSNGWRIDSTIVAKTDFPQELAGVGQAGETPLAVAGSISEQKATLEMKRGIGRAAVAEKVDLAPVGDKLQPATRTAKSGPN